MEKSSLSGSQLLSFVQLWLCPHPSFNQPLKYVPLSLSLYYHSSGNSNSAFEFTIKFSIHLHPNGVSFCIQRLIYKCNSVDSEHSSFGPAHSVTFGVLFNCQNTIPSTDDFPATLPEVSFGKPVANHSAIVETRWYMNL